MRRSRTSVWQMNDGSRARVHIAFDEGKIGHVVGRATKSKRGVATACCGAIVVTVLETLPAGDGSKEAADAAS